MCACPFVDYCPTQLAAANERVETAVEREHVAAVYDAIAPHFSATRYKPWPRVAQFVASLPLGAVLLDIGCGNGRYMSRDNRIVHLGMDRSIGLLQQSVAHDSRRHAALGSALDLPYRDTCADAAMSIAVIHHFSTLERRIAAVREAARVVRRGGRLLFTAWAWEQDKFKNEPSQDLFVKWKLAGTDETYQRYYHLFEEGELERLCEQVASVKLVESYYDTDNWAVILEKVE